MISLYLVCNLVPTIVRQLQHLNVEQNVCVSYHRSLCYWYKTQQRRPETNSNFPENGSEVEGPNWMKSEAERKKIGSEHFRLKQNIEKWISAQALQALQKVQGLTQKKSTAGKSKDTETIAREWGQTSSFQIRKFSPLCSMWTNKIVFS